MQDSTKELRLLERQFRRLVSVITEKAQSDPAFACELATIFKSSKLGDLDETEKKQKSAFNAVELLHREGREALERELTFRTDAELKDILRQEGVRQKKSQQPFVRSDAILNIITRAEHQLHQGASFLKPGA